MPQSGEVPGGTPPVAPKVVVASPATVLKFGMSKKVRRGANRRSKSLIYFILYMSIVLYAYIYVHIYIYPYTY